jgi:hypothetical protein
MYLSFPKDRVSWTGIVTGYRLDGRKIWGLFLVGGKRWFASAQGPDRLWVPPSLLSGRVLGSLSPTIKRQGREADRSPHAVPRLRMRVAISSTPSYVFTAWRLIKHNDNFNFLLSPRARCMSHPSYPSLANTEGRLWSALCSFLHSALLPVKLKYSSQSSELPPSLFSHFNSRWNNLYLLYILYSDYSYLDGKVAYCWQNGGK